MLVCVIQRLSIKGMTFLSYQLDVVRLHVIYKKRKMRKTIKNSTKNHVVHMITKQNNQYDLTIILLVNRRDLPQSRSSMNKIHKISSTFGCDEDC